MHPFRLVLCLAGLVTFLLVKYLGEPTPMATGERERSAEFSLQSSAELNSTWSSGPGMAVTNTPRRLLSAVEMGRLEINGKVVVVARRSDGLRYRVTKPGGEVLLEEATGAELKALDPELYSRVLALIPVQSSVMGVESK